MKKIQFVYFVVLLCLLVNSTFAGQFDWASLLRPFNHVSRQIILLSVLISHREVNFCRITTTSLKNSVRLMCTSSASCTIRSSHHQPHEHGSMNILRGANEGVGR